MREYINLLVFVWCCAWWAASIYYFVVNWEEHKKKYGSFHIPAIIFTGIFSPGLVIVETVWSIGKWLIGR